MAERLVDAARFYEILDRIVGQVGGPRLLRNCHGGMGWPARGIYFFFEDGEPRSGSGAGPRVVRIGTHGLKNGAQSTLWSRLSQHRGSSKSGLGNHRGSIFRMLVGIALAKRNRLPLPESWDVGRSVRQASRKLNVEWSAVKKAEKEIESLVSEHIGQMPFLWLNINDPAGPSSSRGFIERNAIALLSGYNRPAADGASTEWLGHYCDREKVRLSGLWNNDHVHKSYDPSFLVEMESWIDSAAARL